MKDPEKASAQLRRLAKTMDKMHVSVDQCFYRNICVGEPKHAALLAALTKAYAKGALICPVHLEESIFESSLLPAEQRDQIFALQNALADGWAFHSFAQTLAYGTFNFILDAMYPSLRQARLVIRKDADLTALSAANRKGKEDYIARLAGMPYPPASYRPGMGADELYRHIVAERAGSMLRILTAIKERRTLDTGKPEWEFTLAIGEFLLGLNITSKHCEEIIALVLNREWEAIPQLYSDSRLKAQLELGYLAGRKAKANDYLDLTRISVALSDARVILCDHPMADLIKQSKILEIFGKVTIFSTRQVPEATAFFAKL